MTARSPSELDALRRDARRYRRLQILGCAPYGTRQLSHGEVLRFSGLDAHLDADIAINPSRGEAEPILDVAQGEQLPLADLPRPALYAAPQPMADAPWRDPERYKTGRIVKCYGCGAKCHKTHWGHWCYACNVARIDRISGVLEAEVARHGSLLNSLENAPRGNYEDRHPNDMVLHPLSEIREWDEALAVLGIQDSTQTPADAIRELNAEIDRSVPGPMSQNSTSSDAEKRDMPIHPLKITEMQK